MIDWRSVRSPAIGKSSRHRPLQCLVLKGPEKIVALVGLAWEEHLRDEPPLAPAHIKVNVAGTGCVWPRDDSAYPVVAFLIAAEHGCALKSGIHRSSRWIARMMVAAIAVRLPCIDMSRRNRDSRLGQNATRNFDHSASDVAGATHHSGEIRILLRRPVERIEWSDRQLRSAAACQLV